MLPTGADRFDEAVAYAEKYQLYDDALSIWKDTARYPVSLCNTLNFHKANVIL